MRFRPSRRAAIGAILTGTALLAGCTSGPVEDPGFVYVSMGDSFTSGPGIDPILDEDCGRSERNYPQLLAAELEVDQVVDASCGSAGTFAITRTQETPSGSTVPPQIDRVDETTDLVTISLGGGDAGLYAALTTQCIRFGGDAGSPCTDELDDAADDPAELLEPTIANLVRGVERIRERAPDAQVVLVGYPHLLDEDRACEVFPLADGDQELPRLIVDLQNDALRAAAEQAGVPFVDVAAEIRGHGVCSEDPWISGIDGAAPFHPLEPGMRRVAELVAQTVRESAPA